MHGCVMCAWVRDVCMGADVCMSAYVVWGHNTYILALKVMAQEQRVVQELHSNYHHCSHQTLFINYLGPTFSSQGHFHSLQLLNLPSHNEIHNIQKPREALPSQVFQVLAKSNQRAQAQFALNQPQRAQLAQCPLVEA